MHVQRQYGPSDAIRGIDQRSRESSFMLSIHFLDDHLVQIFENDEAKPPLLIIEILKEACNTQNFSALKCCIGYIQKNEPSRFGNLYDIFRNNDFLQVMLLKNLSLQNYRELFQLANALSDFVLKEK
ncbi:MAG: hypothetical protein HWD61_14445 [Parachlamydiaceae bacterium]|nr:MAG: hypothetical protein HWD61_14445 [Parachlamydiaceae bacterium]